MKKEIAIIALSAAALAAPSLVAAQDYYNSDTACQQTVNNKTTAGGLIGAGIGAVAGRSIASRGQRDEGAVLGAVVGAVVGSQIGKKNVACDDSYEANRRTSNYDDRSYSYSDNRDYRNSGYGNNRYDNDRYDRTYRGHNARYHVPVNYNRGHKRCGWGTVAYRLPNGRIINDQVWMCRNRHGEWVVRD